MLIRLNSNDYSELVIRKALYWCSPYGKWRLNRDGEYWLISISDLDGEGAFDAELYRHLNDYTLRERLDKNTGFLRDKIIVSALTRIAHDVG